MPVAQFDSSFNITKTNMNTKTPDSELKTSFVENKSPYDSLEDNSKNKIENNTNTDTGNPFIIRPNKFKIVRSSSAVISANIVDAVNLSSPVKLNRKRLNASQDNIVLDYKRPEMDIDELFDHDMEKLIKRLRNERTNFEEYDYLKRKEFKCFLSKESQDKTNSKEEKRKKFLKEFKSNCKENREFLNSITKNTESKVKKFLQENSKSKKGRQNSVDFVGRLETNSIISNQPKSKILKKTKVKVKV